MKITLREYQARAIEECVRHISDARNPVLVAPTGSGKTIMGMAIARNFDRAVWVVHRLEIIDQLRKHPMLRDGDAIESIQGLQQNLARLKATYPDGTLIIFDEAHHLAADQWEAVPRYFLESEKHPILGLTATPERSDGKGLGKIFNAIVPAASYSELIEAKHLVPVDVYAPESGIDSGIAQDAVTAYQKHGGDAKAFVYARDIGGAHRLHKAFSDAGIPADTILGNIDQRVRVDAIEAFRAGKIKILVNVFCLTEGVDVPDASVCIIARGCSSVGTYLQMVGRIMRPAPGKERGILIDLPGAVHKFGLPTDDRDYSLDDRCPISTKTSLRQCPACGFVCQPGTQSCERCGYVWPVPKPVQVKIWNLDLKRVYAKNDTPSDAKQQEWSRLAAFSMSRGFAISWALKKYRELFPGETPTFGEEVGYEYKRLERQCNEKGYKKGWVFYRMRDTFGDAWEDKKRSGKTNTDAATPQNAAKTPHGESKPRVDTGSAAKKETSTGELPFEGGEDLPW